MDLPRSFCLPIICRYIYLGDFGNLTYRNKVRKVNFIRRHFILVNNKIPGSTYPGNRADISLKRVVRFYPRGVHHRARSLLSHVASASASLSRLSKIILTHLPFQCGQLFLLGLPFDLSVLRLAGILHHLARYVLVFYFP